MPKIPNQVSEAGREARETYRRALPYGERWAEMCALQLPPGTKGTDRAFQEGRLNDQWLDAMPPATATKILREARASGISTTGKQYVGGLADHRAHRDPDAWVDSTSDVLRVAKKKNLTVEGIVNHKGVRLPPRAAPLSERIIKEDMRYYRKLHPKLPASELRQIIIDKHAHPKKKLNK